MEILDVKREIIIDEFHCPFCNASKTIKTSEIITNEETEEHAGFGVDYWECSKCGYENDIFPEGTEDDFKSFEHFVENQDWKCLFKFFQSKDTYILFEYSKLLIQKKNFQKALGCLTTILKIDPKDTSSTEIKKHLEKLLECEKIKKNIPFKFEDIIQALEGFEGIEYCLDKKTGEMILVRDFEEEYDRKQMTDEKGRYIQIFPIPANEKYEWMKQFIETIGHEQAKRELIIAISGKSAFSRFKTVLNEYPEVEEWWYGFKNRILWNKAIDWVIDELDDARRSYI